MSAVGVIVGRFQVGDLHDGHRWLINHVLNAHQKVIIFLGVPRLTGTKRNPLDYITRERMIRAAFPEVTVLGIQDNQSDKAWSTRLDESIKMAIPNAKSAVLYGGRNSFSDHYFGAHETCVVNSDISFENASDQRKALGQTVRNSADFRAGIIYSSENSWPYTKLCVDIAMFKEVGGKLYLLLGKKNSEMGWRLPGGAVDEAEQPERAAIRELVEETGMTLEGGEMRYVDTYPVSDWRVGPGDGISFLTSLFTCDYAFGIPAAMDDLDKTTWFQVDLLLDTFLMSEHIHLIKKAIAFKERQCGIR